MKLFVCGSRKISDTKWVFSEIEKYLNELGLVDYTNLVILEGTARGVDTIAKEWATEHNISVIEYPPNYEQYRSKACYKRNESMAIDCDFMLNLWTGESTGSLHSLVMAEKYNKPYKVCIYNNDKVFKDAAEEVCKTSKEIFCQSENIKNIFKLFNNEVCKCVIKREFNHTKSEWEEGHNFGSSFWIMPLKQNEKCSKDFCEYYRFPDEEISIDESVVLGYLYLPFLKPYYDKSIKDNCGNFSSSDFDWFGLNLYSYVTMKKIVAEMKKFSRDASLEKSVSDFYSSLADRILLMMNRQPDCDYISFEGP